MGAPRAAPRAAGASAGSGTSATSAVSLSIVNHPPGSSRSGTGSDRTTVSTGSGQVPEATASGMRTALGSKAGSEHDPDQARIGSNRMLTLRTGLGE